MIVLLMDNEGKLATAFIIPENKSFKINLPSLESVFKI